MSAFIKGATAVAAILIGGQSHAVPMIVTAPIVRATAPVPPAVATFAGACMWQVPGELRWVNLYGLSELHVSKVLGGYETRLDLTTRNRVVIPIPAGADVTTHTSAVVKRLAECGGGAN